jgi:hypothetical protein
LQSSNFSTGSTGWQIKGDGTAEFDSQYIRGDLNAGSVTIGNGTYNYWNKTGQENDFRVGDATTYLLWDNSEGTLTVAGDASISGTLTSVDGTFTGTLSGVDGTFTGTLSGVGGTFTSNVVVGSDLTDKITIASDTTATGTKIFSGTGTYNNSNTGFYMDASGRFSLKDKFSWDGTNITLNGTTATSDLEINGAIVTGGIIRTNSDTDNNDAVAIQEDRIYIYNRGGGAGEIRFESDNSSDVSKIVASTGGVSFECDSQTGDATFINGASSSRPEFNWKGWGATFASLYQNTSSGGLAVFSLGGSSSSYIQSNNFYIAQNGGTSALPLRFSNDTDTGIYRYSDGSTGTGLGLVANGTLIFAAHTTNSNGTGPSLYMNAPATTTTSGYRFLLRSTTFGGVAEFASNRYLKDNIQTFDYSGFIMDSLNPIKYVPSYLGEDEELEQDKILRENDIQHGFIAEDISQVMGGILATFDENLNPTGWRWPDLIAICVAEIKSLRSRVAQLESL